jgi:hypothetical protein
MQLRWISGALYLFIGVPLLVMNATEKPMIGLQPSQWTLALGVIATAMGLFRLWTAATMYRKSKPPALTRRRRVEGASLEYNPEFDFNRPGPQSIPTDEEPPKA